MFYFSRLNMNTLYNIHASTYLNLLLIFYNAEKQPRFVKTKKYNNKRRRRRRIKGKKTNRVCTTSFTLIENAFNVDVENGAYIFPNPCNLWNEHIHNHNVRY